LSNQIHVLNKAMEIVGIKKFAVHQSGDDG
jgi:hypothetical protein